MQPRIVMQPCEATPNARKTRKAEHRHHAISTFLLRTRLIATMMEEKPWIEFGGRGSDDDETGLWSLFQENNQYETFQYSFGDDDIRISLKARNAEDGQTLKSTGLTVWRASSLLCDYLYAHMDIVRNKTVLEVRKRPDERVDRECNELRGIDMNNFCPNNYFLTHLTAGCRRWLMRHTRPKDRSKHNRSNRWRYRYSKSNEK